MKNLTIIILFLFSNVIFANECISTSENCDFYKCQEQKHKCGPEGFFIQIGQPFCSNFHKLSGLSKEGSEWLVRTRKCLQDKIQDEKSFTCETIADKTINHHIECFNKYEMCTLPISDLLTVFKLVVFEELPEQPGYISKNILASINTLCLSQFFKD
jgi:hypothetical protein